MITYKNGSYIVEQYLNGTKILKDPSGKFESEFPDNLDVKITDYCTTGCKFCYENSTVSGKHCSENILIQKLSKLPEGVEITLGGGNPLSHPKIVEIVNSLKEQGKLVSLTVNENNIDTEVLGKCTGLRALGISPLPKESGKVICCENIQQIPIVFHFILGVHPLNQIENYLKEGKKILILGYKSVGRGKNIIPNLQEWISGIKRLKYRLSDCGEFPDNATMSFDNLAINQLNLKTSFTTKDWEVFYLGDDGSCSMYIDAVEGTYSESSTVSKVSRTSWNDLEIIDYFKNAKTTNNAIR